MVEAQRLMKKLIPIIALLWASSSWADNAKLNAAIQNVSSQTVVLSGKVSSLASHQATLMQKYLLTNAGQCGLFIVGISTGNPGGPLPVTLSFIPTTSTTTAIQADLFTSSSFTATGIALGPAGTTAGKSVQMSNVGGSTRVLIFGLNTTPIGLGTVATLTYSSIAATPKGIYPIMVGNFIASDPNGNLSPLCATSGIIKL